jgi:rrf2 family protein (putative transcriptional regulator)
MRISSKGRYALVSMINMAQNYNSGKFITVISISEKYNISKIYLEQVFSLLKRGGLVTSVKGAQGGYQLTRTPQQITVYDILNATEASLFEETESTIVVKAKEIEKAMQNIIFLPLDAALTKTMKDKSLLDLVNETEKQKGEENIMFYI